MEYRIKKLSEYEAQSLHQNTVKKYHSMSWTSLKQKLGRVGAVFNFVEVEEGVFKVDMESVLECLDKIDISDDYTGYSKGEIRDYIENYHWDIGWLEPYDELARIRDESEVY